MVSKSEPNQISRIMLSWLNEYPDKPVDITNYEYLNAGVPGMALSTIQAEYKVKQYILGGYLAQYQFKVVYRVQPGNSNNNRLKAEELLSNFGYWASKRTDMPVLGDGIRCKQIKVTAPPSFYGRYENGDEDYQILMNMFYEVI